MFVGRKGDSQVMATVLFVILVLVLVSAIAFALVPTIKKSLTDLGSCFEAQYSIDLVRTRIACYDSDVNLGGVTVHVNKQGLKKFRIAFIDSSGSSTTFNVINGDNPSGFGAFGQGPPGAAGSQQLQLPEEGQQLTYVASGANFVKAEISPIVKSDVCPIDDSIELNLCASDVNLAQEPLINVFIAVN